jgi:N-acylglucosamine-6-phosphate 2-epimerase
MNELMKKFYKGIIVSCQAFEGEPLYADYSMARMALSALDGGAKGIRTNGIRDIKQIREVTDVPIIGLYKDYLKGYDVFITPTSTHALEVLEAGADIVAFDCTDRKRPEPLENIFVKIREKFPEKLIMADIASFHDAENILKLRPDILATTLSSYTEETVSRPKPDLELLKKLVDKFNVPVVAEGNYWEPEEVVKALDLGAYAVTVGSAITRPHLITKRFNLAVENWNKKQSVKSNL